MKPMRLVATLALALAGCQHNGNAQAGDEPSPAVTFATAQGEVTFAVEVADSPEERAEGLMYRRELDPKNGMIFVFPREEEHAFWMRNTYLSLDMIFLDGDKSVVGIVAEAEPLTETTRTVGAPSKYVVEIVGGLAEDSGIVTGTHATFSDVPDSTPR